MSERWCQCVHWAEWAADPFCPIWFNPSMNEYNILFGEQAANCIVVRFCPSCGGRMPESRRGDSFTTPSREEFAEARALLQGVRDVGAMRSALGEPDEIFDWS